MTNDELAAVVAAAHVLLAASADEPAAAISPAWNVAARMQNGDPERLRLVDRSRSRWALSGRLA